MSAPVTAADSLPDEVEVRREPTTAELADWRSAEGTADAVVRAADAAERASAAAERAAVAAEQVAEAALVTLEAAKKSLDVVRSSVVEARAAAGLSVAEQAGTADFMRDAQGASEASRERYQARIAELRTGNGQTGEDGSPEITD